MSIWTFLGQLLAKIVVYLEDFTIFYGISAWTIFLIVISILDLTMIIRSIFQTSGGDDKQ